MPRASGERVDSLRAKASRVEAWLAERESAVDKTDEYVCNFDLSGVLLRKLSFFSVTAALMNHCWRKSPMAISK